MRQRDLDSGGKIARLGRRRRHLRQHARLRHRRGHRRALAPVRDQKGDGKRAAQDHAPQRQSGAALPERRRQLRSLRQPLSQGALDHALSRRGCPARHLASGEDDLVEQAGLLAAVAADLQVRVQSAPLARGQTRSPRRQQRARATTAD